MSNMLSFATALVFFFTLLCISSASCNRDDKRALLSVMSSFPPNSFPSSWNSSQDCCQWDYVSCDDTTGRVNILQITDNDQLSGPIPSSMGRFSSLTFLILRNLPNVIGPIPHQLLRLRNLQFFIISNTGVSGHIPSFFSKLTQLIAVDLRQNKLSGPIPASLGHNAGVGLLYLSGNQLTGTIPGTLFSRSPKNASIQLDLSNNQLTGQIPGSFGDLNFIQLDLSSNRLCGKIPTAGPLGTLAQFNPSFFANNKCLCGAPLPPCSN